MTASHESKVRRFYDESPEGEGAGAAYTALMGDVWHHGSRLAEQDGKSPLEAAVILERQLMDLARLQPANMASDTVDRLPALRRQDLDGPQPRGRLRALDFGSGPGGATLNLAEMTGATFVGLSNTDTLSQRARAAAAERGMTGQVCFLTVGDHDYRTLRAWPDGSFDAVTFFESVCHLPDKEAFFHAAYRILKPGGRLVGMDWLQRPYGEYQSEEQIRAITDPVCEHIRLAGLGTVDGYAAMMRAAGFEVTDAVDEFAGEPCWGSTPAEDRQKWLTYDGQSGELFQDGKRALDAARRAGVFTVGWFAATRH